MRILILLLVIALFVVVHVNGRKKKNWLKEPKIVVLNKEQDEFKEEPAEEEIAPKPRKKHHHRSHHHASHKNGHHHLNFRTDALPYSSPFSRPYDWNMYTDGPYGWGPARKKRATNSFYLFKRSLYPQNYAPQYNNNNNNQQQQQQQQPMAHQPAQQAAYYQPAPRPYNYQAAASRNTLAQASPQNRRLPLAQTLRKKAPEVQKPRERTWVDKLGVKWTTRKVNDYKWGEREPGIVMDEYAGGPFGFDDVKRSQILHANQQRKWIKRTTIPKPSSDIHPRSWIDSYGVRWTYDHVNDYKWGEREPGINMDEYNGGPYGWNDVKRSQISLPASIVSRRNMYMDKP